MCLWLHCGHEKGGQLDLNSGGEGPGLVEWEGLRECSRAPSPRGFLITEDMCKKQQHLM